MSIMLGKKMGDSGAEETTSAVPAARFGVKAAVGACVLAAAVSGGFGRVGRVPIPEPAIAVSAAIGDRIDDVKSNGTYIAQRVFGGAHPIAAAIEESLRNSRAILDA